MRNKSDFNLIPALDTANISTAAPASSSAAASSSTLLDVEGLLGLPPSLLQITEDQLPCTSFTADPNTPFVSFSPPLDHDDYLWSLEDGEGVSDFFDTYDLGDLLKSWGTDRRGRGGEILGRGYLIKCLLEVGNITLWSHHSLWMPCLFWCQWFQEEFPLLLFW